MRKIIDVVLSWLAGLLDPDPAPTDEWYRDLAGRAATPSKRPAPMKPLK
jgi:hypothetical protein